MLLRRFCCVPHELDEMKGSLAIYGLIEILMAMNFLNVDQNFGYCKYPTFTFQQPRYSGCVCAHNA